MIPFKSMVDLNQTMGGDNELILQYCQDGLIKWLTYKWLEINAEWGF